MVLRAISGESPSISGQATGAPAGSCPLVWFLPWPLSPLLASMSGGRALILGGGIPKSGPGSLYPHQGLRVLNSAEGLDEIISLSALMLPISLALSLIGGEKSRGGGI